MLHSRPTLALKSLIPHLPIWCLLPLPPHLCPLLLGLLPPLPPDSFRVLQWNDGGVEPESLSCYTFFCPTPLTLSVSRNPILAHFCLSGLLDSLLCVLNAPSPGLAFSLVMLRRLAATFSSARAYPSLNFLLLSLFA